MLPLTDITQLAIKVQQASQARENTAIRVGTAIAELVKYVKSLPDTGSFEFNASQKGLDLVINTDAEDGQNPTTTVNIPVLTEQQAGIVTPAFIQALKTNLTDDLQKKWRKDDDSFKQDIGQAFNDFAQAQQLRLTDALTAMNTNNEHEREQVQLLFDAIAKGKVKDGVYYLGTYVSDEVMSSLQSSFPMLDIRQPEYTVIKYHDSVPNGTYASNLDNRTGYQFGKAYAPSGHVSKILDARERVILHKGSDGVKRYARLNQENPALSLAGETIDYTGDKGWAMNLEPEYWYKGVNDIINKEHYAAFAFGKKPSNPRGKKLEGATLLATKTAGYAYSSVSNYDIVTLDAHKVQDSGYMTINVDVSGYRYARFPFAKLTKGGYGHVFLDANGRKVGHAIVDAFEDTWDGCYLVYPIPENATMMCLTYPSNFVLDFVWLTASDNPADWEPDWVHHPRRFVSFEWCKYDNPTAGGGQTYDPAQTRAYIGTKKGTDTTGKKIQFVLDNADTLAEGFGMMRYEDFKDLMQLYWARYGKRNAENTFTTGSQTGAEQLHTLPVGAWTEFKGWKQPNITHLPGGSEVQTKFSLFMGYHLLSSFTSFPFFDLMIDGGGVALMGYKYSKDGRKVFCPVLGNNTTVKTLTGGRFLDMTPATVAAGANTTDYYAARSNIDGTKKGQILSLTSTGSIKTHIGNPLVTNTDLSYYGGGVFLNCDGEDVVEVDTYNKILV